MNGNQTPISAALLPLAKIVGLGGMVIGVYLLLAHYVEKGTDTAPVAAQNRVSPYIPGIATAEALTQPETPYMQPTMTAPPTIDPVAIEMAVMQQRLEEVERSMLKARIEMTKASYEIGNRTANDAYYYIAKQPYPELPIQPQLYPSGAYNNTLPTADPIDQYSRRLAEAEMVHMSGNLCIGYNGQPIQCVCSSTVDCQRLQ